MISAAFCIQIIPSSSLVSLTYALVSYFQLICPLSLLARIQN